MTTPAKVENKSTVTPLMDVYESDQDYLLIGDLPGVAPDQLDIRVDKGVLSVETRGVDPQWEYKREYKLSDDVDSTVVEAKLDAGVLELRLPKRAEIRPRKIEIKTA
jgi:HSP20 family molecular chaperone IbpA